MQSDAFCDWLDVTFSPDDNPVHSIEDFIQSLCFSLREKETNKGRTTALWGSPDRGQLHITTTKKHVRVSASGGVIEHLRVIGSFAEYLTVLSTCPYRITRLDVAVDVYENATPVVQKLIRHYPTTVALLRKKVATKWILGSRDDGQISGTFYAGDYRKGGVTARVYDKQKELMDKRGLDQGPCTRYEVTVRRGLGCTLRDAIEPAPLFWHVASPALLECQGEVLPWVPADLDDLGWTVPMSEYLPYQILKRRMESLPDYAPLARLCDDCGPHGRTLAVRMFETYLMGAKNADEAAAMTTTDTEEDGVAA